ncbi:MAG: O-antigen ligase family protein [Fischerella sp.]|nr:O-antigen ligase family protein [Fischerella sp.]
MTKYKLPFLPHPDPRLQFSWNSAQLGLLIFPLIPFWGAVILGLVMLGTWFQKYHTIIRRPQNLGFALLGILLIISTGFAFDQKVAILGLFNFLPFILFFAAFSTLIQTPAQLRQLSWILVITSVPIVSIGLGQLFCGWTTPPQWKSVFGWAIVTGGEPPGRMASVFMYANILAGYLVIVFILSLGLWLEAYQKTRDNRSSRLPRVTKIVVSGVQQPRSVSYFERSPIFSRWWGWGETLQHTGSYSTLCFLFLTAVAIANFIALILTYSRNAWAIAFLACLVYALYQGWRILFAGVTTVVMSVLLAAFAPSAIAKFFRKFVPAYFWARLNDQIYSDRPVVLLRKTQWQFAWSLTQQRPWTGWGLRNFTQLYEAQMNVWLGHPHNLFLMLSAETGLPTTILFCALLSWIFIAGVQCLQNSKYLDSEDRLILFSYLVVFGALVLFNTFDVTLFDLRLNTLSWLPIAAISGVVHRYNQHEKLADPGS